MFPGTAGLRLEIPITAVRTAQDRVRMRKRDGAEPVIEFSGEADAGRQSSGGASSKDCDETLRGNLRTMWDRVRHTRTCPFGSLGAPACESVRRGRPL